MGSCSCKLSMMRWFSRLLSSASADIQTTYHHIHAYKQQGAGQAQRACVCSATCYEQLLTPVRADPGTAPRHVAWTDVAFDVKALKSKR